MCGWVCVGGWVCVCGWVCGWVCVGGWVCWWVGGWVGVWVGGCVGGCVWVGVCVGGCVWVGVCVGGGATPVRCMCVLGILVQAKSAELTADLLFLQPNLCCLVHHHKPESLVKIGWLCSK